MLDWALKYRNDLHWSVIPVHRNKVPALRSWDEFQERYATEQEIQGWFEQGHNNLGVVTGKISGIDVVDLDGFEGAQTAERLGLKSKVISRTGKGFQLFFRCSGLKTTRKELPGLDTRGTGGYVVVPPSVHYLSKPYKWDKEFSPDDLEPVPQNLLEALAEKKQPELQPRKLEGWMIKDLNSIQPMDGNSGRTPTFVRVIGGMKSKGLAASDIIGLLTPWAEKHGYQRLEELVEDQFKRYPPVLIPEAVEASHIESFLSDEQKVEWFVPGLIAKNSLGFVAGLPETLKTWLLIDLAVECARGGGKWLKKFPCSKAKVLFIDQERYKGETQRRFKAVIKGKNLRTADLELFVRTGTTTRLDLQHSLDAFKKELANIKPDLVIIDSFATFHTSEENDRSSVQKVLEAIKALRSEFNCTFIFIDHENKSVFQDMTEGTPATYGKMVGSVAKPAAAEFVFTVRKNNGTAVVHHTKSTLAQVQDTFYVSVKDLTEDKSEISVEAA
jgi:hypothetical protein